ncbi:tail protein [Klebsiella phage Emom]|uniref:Probable tail spike protein n=1 Tax=Klebsiella phage Emom TaxID=3018529 RepID=A0AAF0IEA4_9CAUD|nr:tail protein [Klebsiella phage Emom]
MDQEIKTVIQYPTGDTEYDIPFDYLSRKFVRVSLVSDDNRRQLSNITEYRYMSKTRVKLLVSTTGFDRVEVRRFTSATERVIDFSDGSVLRANDLNVSQLQSSHIAEEARDAALMAMPQDDAGNLDARNRRIVRLADGIEPTDAVNKNQLDETLGDAGGILSEVKEVQQEIGDYIEEFANGTTYLKNIVMVYNQGSAVGGETTIVINRPDPVFAVPTIYINGDRQDVGYQYEYNNVTKTITLVKPLHQGDFVVMMTSEGTHSLSSILAGPNGAAGIGTRDGLTVQEALDRIFASRIILPQWFGARGDWSDTTNTGTDDTAAFEAAIEMAVTLNYTEVYVPAGSYLITRELNLNGGNRNTRLGARIRGAGWASSVLVFKAPAPETPCISIIGTPGSHTSKGVEKLLIKAHPQTVGQGIGILCRNTCFAHVTEFIIANLNVGIRLENYMTAGSFTEFCYFTNGRLFTNNINIQFNKVQNGDNSFHGSNFKNVQNQVKKNGGIGVQIVGNPQGSAYLYNMTWDMQFFGGAGCIAMDLNYCNTDYVGGKLTGESDLTFKADGNSRFDFHGRFDSIGKVIWDTATEGARTGGTYVFANRTSLENAVMTNAGAGRLPAGVAARPLPADWADRNNNGVYPATFHIRGPNVESIGFATYNAAGNGFYFGHLPYQGNIKDFNPSFWFNSGGTSFRTAATAYTMILSNDAGLYFSDTTIRALSDGNVALGEYNRRFKEARFSSWDITAHIVPTSTASKDIGSNTNRVRDLYLVNAPNVTSDSRKKSFIKPIDDALLDAWETIPFSQWKLNDSVAQKGDAARWHVGYIAQKVEEALKAKGLNPDAYGLITYGEDGWMLRMEECLAVESAMIRRKLGLTYR